MELIIFKGIFRFLSFGIEALSAMRHLVVAILGPVEFELPGLVPEQDLAAKLANDRHPIDEALVPAEVRHHFLAVNLLELV